MMKIELIHVEKNPEHGTFGGLRINDSPSAHP